MTADQLTQIITQLGISIIFLWLWYRSDKERQSLYTQMMQLQTVHRAEMMRIIEHLARIPPRDDPPQQ